MGSFVRALLILARQYRRIGKALEDIRDLYVLDCDARGIRKFVPGLKDEVEVAYPGDRRKSTDDEWG
jgi:hypothetical protein